MESVLTRAVPRSEDCPPELLRHLPPAMAAEVRRQWDSFRPEELRLRRGSRSCLCREGETRYLPGTLTQEMMDKILCGLCGGSMYAHQETLRQGYLTLRGGIRVGVCGRMRTDGRQLLGICEVSSLVFRVPRAVAVPTDTVCRLLRKVHPGRGVLIYSPPGVGKTTLLRGLIGALTAPPHTLRLAVIDTREELSACGTDTACGAEWLSGYPRAAGIEIATRTLSPQLIVCDEIGETAEAEAICAACNAGVPLLATAHGEDAESLLRRRGLRLLHERGVFGSYVGLSRCGTCLTQRVTPAGDICGRV